MKCAILTVGDELLIGQVTNSNASWMGEALTKMGVQVALHYVCADKTNDIQQALQLCLDKVDAVLVSGGLGPTHDDITVESIAAHFKLKLKLDEEWVTRMRAFFKERGREMTDNNLRQAMLPDGATRLDNDCGTAPGIWLEVGSKCIAIMPGVPFEMKSLMDREVLPRLKKRSGTRAIAIRTLQTTGIGESMLADRIGDLSDFLSDQLQLAYLPSPLGVRLRITAYGSTEAKAEAEAKRLEARLMPHLEKYFFGTGDTTLEEAVGNLLKARGKTVSTAESCTGGLVMDKFTDVAGSSAYVQGAVVAYANAVKESVLGVPRALLDAHGAVSEPVVKAMAEGVRKFLKTDYALALSGVAGPDGGTAEKPVGLIWIAVSDANGTVARKFQFEKHRRRNKERAAQAALELLRQRLLESNL